MCVCVKERVGQRHSDTHKDTDRERQRVCVIFIKNNWKKRTTAINYIFFNKINTKNNKHMKHKSKIIL